MEISADVLEYRVTRSVTFLYRSPVMLIFDRDQDDPERNEQGINDENK